MVPIRILIYVELIAIDSRSSSSSRNLRLTSDHCCRQLMLKGFESNPPSIRASHLTDLRMHGMSQVKLSRDIILWISAITSLSRLELQGWHRWDDVRPLGLLPLRELVSDRGLYLLSDMLGPDCLQNLRSATLQIGSKSAQLRNKKRVASVKKCLLLLPKFRLLSCSERMFCGSDPNGLEDAVESIVNAHRVRWQCLYSRGHDRLYQRI
jgi:hypothetical protein